MKKFILVFLFFIGTITLYALDRTQQKNHPEEALLAELAAIDDKSINLSHFTATSKEQPPTVSFRVVLSPLQRTRLSSQISSPVEIITKRMGESFKKGEILIRLDDDVYIGNLKKAQATLMKAITEFEGRKELYSARSASLFELKEAEANLQSAESDVIVAKKNLDAAYLLAPYDGKVVSISIEEHELPISGKELIEVVDDSILLAKLLVPSNFISQIKLGDPLDINVKELGRTVQARISRISPVIDPSSSTFKVDAEIDNRTGVLKAGMTGTTTLQEANKNETSINSN